MPLRWNEVVRGGRRGGFYCLVSYEAGGETVGLRYYWLMRAGPRWDAFAERSHFPGRDPSRDPLPEFVDFGAFPTFAAAAEACEQDHQRYAQRLP